MGITGHYILEFELQTALLSCKRFRGAHTGEAIFECYQDIIDEYKILSKTLSTVTDSASNMIKAFSLPGYESESAADDEELVGDVEPVSAEDDDDINIMASFPRRISCFTHTLQLVVSDGLKESGQLKTVINKVSKLISHVRKSHHATELLEGCNKLQLANATRWNSQLKMLRSLLQVPQAIIDQIDFPTKPRAHELKLLKELCTILTPFEEASNISQGENIVTSSEVIVCVRSLREQLQSLSETFSCRLLSSLQTSLEKRLSKYEDMEVFQLAATLDPRYKLDWCTDNEFEILKKMLLKKADFAPDTITELSDECPPPSKRAKPGLSFMKDRSHYSHASCDVVGTASEINDYLSQPCLPDNTNVLLFWKSNQNKYPALAKLASVYLAIPASSAPVERIFSLSGKIFRPERCSISDSLFENLMFIRCNEN